MDPWGTPEVISCMNDFLQSTTTHCVLAFIPYECIIPNTVGVELRDSGGDIGREPRIEGLAEV